jgi:ATP-binding cassette subfamily F protein 3
VSHDRYFVDKLATKVIDVGGGEAVLYPGNYEELLWSRKQQAAPVLPVPAPSSPRPRVVPAAKGQPVAAAKVAVPDAQAPAPSYEDRKRLESDARRAKKALSARRERIDALESRIAEREQAIRDIESTMSAPGFYDNHEIAKPIIDKHQALMWEVGDLMHQWEVLQQTEP